MIEVEIDKLINSIEEVATGRSLDTAVLPATAADLKTALKKNGWLFDWRGEARQREHNVFKLVAVEYPNTVQGLLSPQPGPDHLQLHLVESAPVNRGRAKLYDGVPGNLFAFACKLASEQGFAGNVAFTAKTRLVAHYTEKLGAWHIGGGRMILDTYAAIQLVKRYFPKFQL